MVMSVASARQAINNGSRKDIRDLLNALIKGEPYQTYAGTPVGNLTPRAIGEQAFDSTNSTWYKATGLTSSDWAAAAIAALSATEQALLDTALAGTVVNSKVAVYDAAGKLYRSSATPAGAGASVSDATALTAEFNAVTGADGTVGVLLPIAAANEVITVLNTGSAVLKVYAITGSQINALGSTVAYALGAGRSATFIGRSATLWYAPENENSTASAAEQNYLDITTLGTGAASKAVVVDANGDYTMPDNGHFKPSVASVAAAGTNAANATVLADQNNIATGADGVKGVALPAAVANLEITVANDSRNYALFVYPLSGGNDLINELPEDQAFILAPGAVGRFIATSGTQWFVDKQAGEPSKETHFELFDDFLAAAIDTTNNWIVFDGTDGDADLAATVAGVPEGAIRMGSGDGNGADDKSVLSLILLAKGSLISLGKTVFEARVSLDGVAGITWGFGLGDVLANATEVANYTVDSGVVADDAGIANAVSFVFSTDATAPTKWQMASTNASTVGAAGAEAALASGPSANVYTTLRIEVDLNGDARFYVNGVLEGSRALAVATTAILIPYIWGDSAVDAQTVTNCDIDYIRFQGKRPSSNA